MTVLVIGDLRAGVTPPSDRSRCCLRPHPRACPQRLGAYQVADRCLGMAPRVIFREVSIEP